MHNAHRAGTTKHKAQSTRHTAQRPLTSANRQPISAFRIQHLAYASRVLPFEVGEDVILEDLPCVVGVVGIVDAGLEDAGGSGVA